MARNIFDFTLGDVFKFIAPLAKGVKTAGKVGIGALNKAQENAEMRKSQQPQRPTTPDEMKAHITSKISTSPLSHAENAKIKEELEKAYTELQNPEISLAREMELKLKIQQIEKGLS